MIPTIMMSSMPMNMAVGAANKAATAVEEVDLALDVEADAEDQVVAAVEEEEEVLIEMDPEEVVGMALEEALVDPEEEV